MPLILEPDETPPTQFPHAHSVITNADKAAAAGSPGKAAAAEHGAVHVDTELLLFCEDYFRNLE